MTLGPDPGTPTPRIDVFSVPVCDGTLVYAPLHRLAAFVNPSAAALLRERLEAGGPAPSGVGAIVDHIRAGDPPLPSPRRGPLDPCFLGLITTRGCRLACRYCDFATPGGPSLAMDPAMARSAIDAYLEVLRSHGRRRAELHFFGGEPFEADDVVHFAVEYAALRAAELGMTIRFEVTTNGVYGPARAEWISDHFDTVVLSLDGPADIQDRQRPGRTGHGTSGIVERTARILSAGPAELIVRACVTNETVGQMPEIAHWVSREFIPSMVCFETLTDTPRSRAAGLSSPDPWEFARYFTLASRILADRGIVAVLATADLRESRIHFCPVSRDPLIVSPDGTVDACYLPGEYRGALDLRLGTLAGGAFHVDADALEHARNLTVFERRLCADCMCRYHCAGGCHVNHDTARPPGGFDAVCIQTRLVTIAQLLERLGQRNVADRWLADRSALEASVWQPSDRLCSPQLSA